MVDFNEQDPIAYAILYQIGRESADAKNVCVPTMGSVSIATKQGRSKGIPAAIFNEWLAVAVFDGYVSVTHVSTGYAVTKTDAPYLKTALKAIASIVPYIPDAEYMRSTDVDLITASDLKEISRTLSAMFRCWGNSELERQVGCFWKDRQAVENRLVDMCMPRELAEKLAFCNTFE